MSKVYISKTICLSIIRNITKLDYYCKESQYNLLRFIKLVNEFIS